MRSLQLLAVTVGKRERAMGVLMATNYLERMLCMLVPYSGACCVIETLPCWSIDQSRLLIVVERLSQMTDDLRRDL